MTILTLSVKILYADFKYFVENIFFTSINQQITRNIVKIN